MKMNFTHSSGNYNRFCRLIFILPLLAFMAVYSNAQSQIINPQRYWTFNSSNAPSDSMGINNLNFNIYQSQYSIGTNGQVGKYLTLNENSWLIDGGPMTLNTGLTV